MTPRRLLLLALFCWCAAIAGTPLLASMGGWGSRISLFLYEFFSRVCHQIDARSFHLAGHKCAVCARCAAIYCSFLFGVLVFPRLSATRLAAIPMSVLLPFSLMPMGIDVLLATLGIHESNDVTRVTTGFIFGLVLSLALTVELEELIGGLFRVTMRRPPGGQADLGDDSAHRRSRRVPLPAVMPAAHSTPSFVHPQRTTYATKT